jgi:hypothetical protein
MASNEPVRVTVDNFRRAETDVYFERFVKQGAFGKLNHERELAAIDRQTVIRLNRDTLYSMGVFDLDAAPVSITLPDTGKRYMAVQVVNQDHYTTDVLYAPDARTLTKESVGTRYVALLIRTFVNPNDAADVKAVHALQDSIVITQQTTGRFETEDWDQQSLTAIREALLNLAAANGGISSLQMFGREDEVEPTQHLIGTAAGWGGNPSSAALYLGSEPAENDGQTAYTLTIRDVPVDGFWSVSVYNKGGYFEKNDKDAYTVNNVTAEPNADGSVTIHFGGDENATNYLPITPGWNYLLRLYRPRRELLDGAWTAPEAEVMR